ncbi:hypothetical protein R1sor_022495 [Riccia sorocarpa]|uniref:PGG domain-containing protein n=1 Tax=Riccia sorocarpa TaxID=122646 RepID=A0ABD3GP83_9MARC
MRNDWYGLVQEILLQFRHLYATDKEEEEENPSHLLDVNVFKDLLTCKEGGDQISETSDAGSSGLDVFAMAVINCHQAINTLLVRTVSTLLELFVDHPYYKDVVTCTYDQERPEDDDRRVEGTTDLESKTDYREKLCEVLADVFPVYSDYLNLDRAPNMWNGGREIQSEKGICPQTRDSNISQWMLTSPFLSFSEFVILSFARDTYTLFKDSSIFVYRSNFENSLSRFDNSFSRYLLTISDTRRTVMHYATLYGPSHPLLNWILDAGITADDDIWLMEDSSKRTAIHLLLALQGMSLGGESGYGRFSFSELFAHQPKWKPVGRESWEYKGWNCQINICSVHLANGSFLDKKMEYLLQSSRKEDRLHGLSLRLYSIICTSPHLSDTDRAQWFEAMVNCMEYWDTDLSYLLLRPRAVAGQSILDLWHPLSLYVSMGRTALVQVAVKYDCCFDPARFNPLGEASVWWSAAVHIAASRADPEMLRIILESGKFDPHYVNGDGNTLLHAAVECKDLQSTPVMLIDYAEIPSTRFEKLHDREQSSAMDQQKDKQRLLESRRQGCVNLLLQEGVDIWQKNNSGRIPDPGPNASPDYNLWWYQEQRRETQDQKTSFSGAAAAISVTAALVATASYVGPLQPPLGYSSEDVDQIAKVQAGILPVRIFFVCNTMAFYLAVAAVVLSLTPSLPMPHESIREELKRIRRSVTWSLIFLILSLISILLAFGSASVVVIPNRDIWNHGWLTASPMLVTYCSKLATCKLLEESDLLVIILEDSPDWATDLESIHSSPVGERHYNNASGSQTLSREELSFLPAKYKQLQRGGGVLCQTNLQIVLNCPVANCAKGVIYGSSFWTILQTGPLIWSLYIELVLGNIITNTATPDCIKGLTVEYVAVTFRVRKRRISCWQAAHLS